MNTYLPAFIVTIIVVGLFIIEPMADKKGFGKLLSVVRTALICGALFGYVLYWTLHR